MQSNIAYHYNLLLALRLKITCTPYLQQMGGFITITIFMNLIMICRHVYLTKALLLTISSKKADVVARTIGWSALKGTPIY